jgi:hypothetical protein
MVRNPKSPSAVGKPSRSIPAGIKILLAVRAGGRCEFQGCNEYLFEHPLTMQQGNFSEYAHIVAFSDKGPRAETNGPERSDPHQSDNLMLLCQKCHKLIDDNPEDYSTALLRSFKREHEDRILHATSRGPDMKTSIVQLKAKIGGSAVDIPAADVYEAVTPGTPLIAEAT